MAELANIDKWVIVEAHQESIQRFFQFLSGPDHRQKIIDRYPDAKITFTGENVLPAKEDHQEWACDCGCGGKDPILVPDLNMSVVSPTSDKKDGLEEAEIHSIWVSPCKVSHWEDFPRYFGMCLWDNQADDFVDGVSLEGN